MKKRINCLMLSFILLFCTGCGATVAEEEPKATLDESKMRSICKLATLECYYHNVAKYQEKNVSGMLWWKKDERFWVSYSGVVTLGVEASELELKTNGTNVKITLPEGKVLGSRIDDISEESFYIDPESVKPSAEDQTKACADAEEKMVEEARNDEELLDQAEQRAKDLLEHYVENIGEITNTEYTIEWNVIDNTPDSTEAVEDTQL